MISRRLIKKVSRSFSLSLLFLPKEKRDAVTLAYLLARFGDTLVDCGERSVSERLTYLEKFEFAIREKNSNSWKMANFPHGLDFSELELMQLGPELLNQYSALSPHDQKIIYAVIQKLFGAMKWDLSAFDGGTELLPKAPVLEEAQFDWYCENIAGCVGEFWVKIFDLPESLIESAVKYGKALQRINIYRDAPEDLKRGRIYFPQVLMKAFGIENNLKWKSNNWKNFSEYYLDQTNLLLQEGLKFSNALQTYDRRLRWASFIPYGIGALTINRLRVIPLSEKRIKISRREVRSLALTSAWQSFIRQPFSSCSSN